MPQRALRKKNNMRDVARVAGVSVATVSRVLNKSDRVSPTTQARVASAMEELNFTPSAAARAINSGRTRMIGALVPTLNHAIFSRFLNALETGLADFGLSLVVATTRNCPQTEVARAKAFMDIGVEGLIVSGVTHDAAFHTLVERHDIPVLATSYFDAANPLTTIGYDNATAARLAFDHLAALGHRRIAVLHGPVAENDRTKERLRGLPRDTGVEMIFFELSVDFEAAGDCVEQLVAQQQGFTAVLCLSDVLAQGSLFRLHRLGHKVPQDISVMGMDDLPSSASVYPSLTTISLPVIEMGTHTANAIGHWVERDHVAAPLELPPKLVIRQSTAAPET